MEEVEQPDKYRILPQPLVDIQNLKVFFNQDKKTEVLKGVNLQIFEGKVTALIGTSGSGKSVTGLALMGLLPKNTGTEGEIIFKDRGDLISLGEKEWKHIRGNKIAIVFQEPMSALNPLMKCGDQILECISDEAMDRKAKQQLVLDWMQKVSIPDPEMSYHKYPHQMSGGQKQRIMIAMAMINRPDLLIADEPSTALDVLVQKEIIQLLKQLQAETNTAVLFITHDLALAQTIADDVKEMKEGRIVERSLETKKISPKGIPILSYAEPLLRVNNVSVSFIHNRKETRAVDDVSFDLYPGETVGLVGGSGCGKTTLSKAILGLEQASSGSIIFQGKDISKLSPGAQRALRRHIQIIFQDPYASLNPRMKAGDAIAEPIHVHLKLPEKKVKEKVKELLIQVGLGEEAYHKYPHEFSGGQRQRICIARAIGLSPELVICDESVAALDVVIQEQILDLLMTLQQEHQLTYLFITHDMNVVRKICDKVIVMKEGRIVESGWSRDVMERPESDYTRQLIEAVP